MSNLVTSVAKASAAKVNGGRATDAKHHGTHQIAEQVIDVRENEGQESNQHPTQLHSGSSPKVALLFDAYDSMARPYSWLAS